MLLGGVVILAVRPFKRLLPLNEEARLLADQMGLDVRQFKLDQQYRLTHTWGCGLLPRGWHRIWRVKGPSGRVDVTTIDSRLFGVIFRDRAPLVGTDTQWTPPLSLAGARSCEVGEVRAPAGGQWRPLGPGVSLGRSLPEVRDCAVLALGAVLGVPVADHAGRAWQPRLTWGGPGVGRGPDSKVVEVELRLGGRQRQLPQRVTVVVIPATREVDRLHVDQW